MNDRQKMPLQIGLERLAEDLRKHQAGPEYCAEHQPCDAKEHTEGHKVAVAIFTFILGTAAWGCVVMLGVNAVCSSWLGVLPEISYWQAVLGVAGLYALGDIRRGLM